jgi:hypothetical protein
MKKLFLFVIIFAFLSCGHDNTRDESVDTQEIESSETVSEESTVFPSTVIIVEGEAEYELFYPGLAFEYISPAFNPPVEGELTEETGIVVSAENPDGIVYFLKYSICEELPSIERQDWLTVNLLTSFSPDERDRISTGEILWREGSLKTEHRDISSTGLVCYMDFRMLDDLGGIYGMGRAYAIFRNGYSTLFYCFVADQ